MRRVKEDRNKQRSQTDKNKKRGKRTEKKTNKKAALLSIVLHIYFYHERDRFHSINANLAFHSSNFVISMSRKIVTNPLHFHSFSSVTVITKPLYLHFHFEFTMFT